MVNESVEMLHLRRRLLDFGRYVSPHLGEASGNPMTFNTDIARNLHKLVIPFEPVQEGEGDPSPDNVRPISGWTGTTIEKRGLNLLIPDDPSTPMANYSHTSSGTVVYDSEYEAFRSVGYGVAYSKHAGRSSRLFIAPFPMTITFSVDYCNVGTDYGIILYKNNSRITDIHGTADSVWHHFNRTFNLDKGEYLWTIHYGSIYWKNMQVVFGDSADEYIPYQAETLPVSWQDEAGTVYGGTVTINEDGSADLVSDVGLTNLGVCAWSTNTASPSNGVYRTMISGMKPNNDTPCLCACSHYNVDKNNVWTATTNWATATDKTIKKRSTFNQIFIKDTGLANKTAAEFKEAMNGVYLAYPLASPITRHLTAGQLKTLSGENVIWSDTNGINTAEYWTHLN